ncbi:MAG: MBL fold metallo-hydrolase [Promethearchaeia archaeon]
MKINSERYELDHPKEHLYTFKEQLSSIHPVYKNDPLNLYLLMGSRRALLIDTGCRIEPIKPIVEEIIQEKSLIIVNTHAHWDHILGNFDFHTVLIHVKEISIISRPYNISFLKDSPADIVEAYEPFNFMIPPAENIESVKHGDSIDLGGISVNIHHTPGHSPGSICLLTTTGELFTGDTAYYGEQFLPPKGEFSVLLNSLKTISQLYENNKDVRLYPSHGRYPCDLTLITKLQRGIKNIDTIWEKKKFHWFFQAYKVEDEHFKYYVPN